MWRHLHGLGAPVQHRPVQRREPQLVRSIQVHPIPRQGLDLGQIAVLGRLAELLLPFRVLA